MKFTHGTFTCDVDVFRSEYDVVVRFYDRTYEQSEGEIINLVIVAPGFGYLCLKKKGEDGLLSGFLDHDVFATDDLIEGAIEFVESLCPELNGAYIPHHVDRFKRTAYVEYNGEY